MLRALQKKRKKKKVTSTACQRRNRMYKTCHRDYPEIIPQCSLLHRDLTIVIHIFHATYNGFSLSLSANIALSRDSPLRRIVIPNGQQRKNTTYPSVYRFIANTLYTLQRRIDFADLGAELQRFSPGTNSARGRRGRRRISPSHTFHPHLHSGATTRPSSCRR